MVTRLEAGPAGRFSSQQSTREVGKPGRGSAVNKSNLLSLPNSTCGPPQLCLGNRRLWIYLESCYVINTFVKNIWWLELQFLSLWQERQSNLEAWTVFAGRTSRKHLETPYCQEAKAQGREGEWMGYGGKNGGLFL